MRGDTIAAVGALGNYTAMLRIDARGLVVAPGFVDTHSHARGGIFETPSAENCIRQGVTTLIEGPDGGSPIPLKPFLQRLAATPIAVNFGMLTGHGSIRSTVMRTENRNATPEEIRKMRELTRQAMEDGALGISTGLFYVPGNYAPTEEVIELAKVAGSMGGLHTSHMRDEAANVVDSVLETIRIGEEGGLPTQVTHHKIIGVQNWGRSVETLRADRGSPRARRGRHHRPVPLHRFLHRDRCAIPAVVAGGRREGAGGAARRAGATREDQGRDRPSHS